MNQSFYIGAVGAIQQQRHLNVHGNNIANLNSYGFKAERAVFTQLINQDWPGINGNELPMGVGTRIVNTTTNFHQAGFADTGLPLDYAIQGTGFFGLVDLTTGEVSFTRCGSFMKGERLEETGETDEEGNPITERVYYLSDGQGRFVLSQRGGLIPVDDVNEELPVGIFDYSSYNGMVHLDDTRFSPVEKDGNVWLGDGTLVRGMLELSNADLAEEMTKVIEAQRAYGMALKMVQTSDEIETTINSLRS